MDTILASLLMLWGNISGNHHDVTMEQLVQASLIAKNAEVQQHKEDTTSKETTSSEENQAKDSTATKETKLTKAQESYQQELKQFIPANKVDPQKNAPQVKGLYASANTAGGSHLDKLLQIIDQTALNAMVIDAKDDYGHITFETNNPTLDALGTTRKIIPDIHKLMDKLNEHHVYPIARIVVFKDTVLAQKKPSWSFLTKSGSVWNTGTLKNPTNFVNPYKKEVWDYNVEIAKEAAKAGFKEIQFDYVRFAESFSSHEKTLTFTKDGRSHSDVVADFVKYAREQLNPLGVRVSVDIFGFTSHVKEASGIGQDFDKISLNTDVINPMVYPSHYSTGWYGFKVPDANPYGIIDGAVKDSLTKFKAISQYQPVLRPWIQDFTASWVKGHIPYGKKQVEDQIKALKDNGINEFLLWNAGNVYTPGVDYTK